MSRVTLFMVVEGHSEAGFFPPFLAAHLGILGIDLHVAVIGKGANKGGMYRAFEDTCRDIARFLAERRRPVVTTFFDYYGLPTSGRQGWDFVPSVKASRGVDGIEAKLREGVAALAGAEVERFIPYVQMHEFEALLFAEPNTLADALSAPHQAKVFTNIVASCKGCESINDSRETAPSKRIQQHCPQYIKGRSSAAHAPRLGKRLDLHTVRAACPRFAAWLTKIEALATAVQA